LCKFIFEANAPAARTTCTGRQSFNKGRWGGDSCTVVVNFTFFIQLGLLYIPFETTTLVIELGRLREEKMTPLNDEPQQQKRSWQLWARAVSNSVRRQPLYSPSLLAPPCSEQN
jgi:hypothetical protein